MAPRYFAISVFLVTHLKDRVLVITSVMKKSLSKARSISRVKTCINSSSIWTTMYLETINWKQKSENNQQSKQNMLSLVSRVVDRDLSKTFLGLPLRTDMLYYSKWTNHGRVNSYQGDKLMAVNNIKNVQNGWNRSFV